MRKGREILHLPIVIAETGQEMARVDDFLWEDRRMVALLATPINGNKPYWIPIQAVTAWEADRIAVSQEAPLEVWDEEQHPGLWHSKDLAGYAVIDEGGKELGRVGDLCVDQDRVVALEITDGLIQDLLTGRFVRYWDGEWLPDTRTVIVHGPKAHP